MNHIQTILYLFIMYWLVVSFLSKKGYLEKYNITAWGPVLMLRTYRGQKFLDYLAKPKKFWRLFANIGLPLMFIGMFAMVTIVVVADYAFISQVQSGDVPEPGPFNQPRNILLIPGLNDFIPLIWGVAGLLVTLMVHEFSHAILCKVEGVRVKSMGLLLVPIPIGGFAEPDEEQLLGQTPDGTPTNKKVASKAERTRILTAGVMANFVTAFIAFAVFFTVLGAIAPSGSILVTDVSKDSAAMNAGLQPDMIITHINDVKINSSSDFVATISGIADSSKVRLRTVKQGTVTTVVLPVENSDFDKSGLIIGSVVNGSAAEASGLSEGLILNKIDDTQIFSFGDFASFMQETTNGQRVTVTVFNRTSSSSQVFNITLGEHAAENGRGFLGVSPGGTYFDGFTTGVFPAREYLQVLKDIPSMLGGLSGWLILFTLPIMGIGGEGFPGFSGLLINFYEPTGWGIPLGVGIFWIANAALWIGWINFYAGLFNCLPAVPLDGGHVFKDALSSLFNRFLKNEARSENLSRNIVAVFALVIFSSFLLMIALPWIVHGF